MGEFNGEADRKCISLKYSPRHLAPSQYGIELVQLQMAAYRGAIYPEYRAHKYRIHHDIRTHRSASNMLWEIQLLPKID